MIGTKYKHFIHFYGNYARGLIWIIAFTIDCLPLKCNTVERKKTVIPHLNYLCANIKQAYLSH